MHGKYALERAANARFHQVRQDTVCKIRIIAGVMPCPDVLPIVLGFLFMSKETHRIQFFKRIIHGHIETADFSRKTDEDLFYDLPEHWLFSLRMEEDIHMQGMNCGRCGGYKILGAMARPIAMSCLCTCAYL